MNFRILGAFVVLTVVMALAGAAQAIDPPSVDNAVVVEHGNLNQATVVANVEENVAPAFADTWQRVNIANNGNPLFMNLTEAGCGIAEMNTAGTNANVWRGGLTYGGAGTGR